ncbi:Protein of unknown function DUF1645 [Macleaya cordata]|uniref:Uncharacterized protein n=1 Tax=Macleaya cordata TaxID=56857 RepID=A0A200PU79_MACCD|nr:Protein of unknown function DUF1645 [Macleaya cordata]
MDIMIPIPATEFNFDSACSTPYMSAPSSPKRFGEYYSAPTSPIRGSAIYHDFNRFGGSASVIPFDWDENPQKPKSNDSEDDFAFDFDGKLERTSLTADELFDGGKIRPLIPQTRSQLSTAHYESTQKSQISSPRSPKSTIAQGKKMFWDAISPREKKESDSYSYSRDQTRKGSEQNRGRGRTTSVSHSSNSNRRETRSLSPLRVAEFAWEEQQQQQQQQQQNTKPTSWNSKNSSSSSSLKGSKKWRFSDFLLFRSASEGRAADKDPLRKYTALSKKNEDEKNSSFRSIDSTGSAASNSRRKGPVSAHELHYKVNRAVCEESKKKTYLPYKPGLLGCIGFNPTAYGLSQRL